MPSRVLINLNLSLHSFPFKNPKNSFFDNSLVCSNSKIDERLHQKMTEFFLGYVCLFSSLRIIKAYINSVRCLRIDESIHQTLRSILNGILLQTSMSHVWFTSNLIQTGVGFSGHRSHSTFNQSVCTSLQDLRGVTVRDPGRQNNVTGRVRHLETWCTNP